MNGAGKNFRSTDLLWSLFWEISFFKWIGSWRLLVGGFIQEREIKAGIDLIQFVLHGEHFLQGVGEFLAQLDRKSSATDVAKYRLAVFQANHVDIKLVSALTM